jgi:hypothetical protein
MTHESDLNIHLESHWNVYIKKLEWPSLVQVRQQNCWSHPAKVGVCCALNASTNVEPVFLMKQLIAKERTAFSTPSVISELQLLHYKCYRPLGMLIHRQNSHAPCGEQGTCRRKSQSPELVKCVKIFPAYNAVSANFCGYRVSRGQGNGSSRP